MCEPGNISRRRSRSSCSSQRPCSKTENKQFMTIDQLALKIEQQPKETTTKRSNSYKEQQQKRSNNNNKCSPPCSQRQTGPCPACRKQWADPSGPAKKWKSRSFVTISFHSQPKKFHKWELAKTLFLIHHYDQHHHLPPGSSCRQSRATRRRRQSRPRSRRWPWTCQQGFPAQRSN